MTTSEENKRNIISLKKHRLITIGLMSIASISTITFSIINDPNYIAIIAGIALLMVSTSNFITLQKRINSESTRT